MPARLRRLLLAVRSCWRCSDSSARHVERGDPVLRPHLLPQRLRAPGRQPDVRGRVDRDDAEHPPGRDLNFNQMTILRYAQKRDALNDAVQRGTDPLGWALAASYFSQNTRRPTTYQWETFGTETNALRRAAEQITRYGKAVGLLVQGGRHAVVMTGSRRRPPRSRGSTS